MFWPINNGQAVQFCKASCFDHSHSLARCSEARLPSHLAFLVVYTCNCNRTNFLTEICNALLQVATSVSAVLLWQTLWMRLELLLASEGPLLLWVPRQPSINARETVMTEQKQHFSLFQKSLYNLVPLTSTQQTRTQKREACVTVRMYLCHVCRRC